MKTTRYAVLLGSALLTIACGSSPMSPSTPASTSNTPDVLPIFYTINIPEVDRAVQLATQFPRGIAIAPAVAQQQFDYTSAYGGTPNVYCGDSAPALLTYQNTGILTAPANVVQLATFTSADWPNAGLMPGRVYQWFGMFAYAKAGKP